jgi:hypothetical protein
MDRETTSDDWLAQLSIHRVWPLSLAKQDHKDLLENSVIGETYKPRL